MIKLGHFVFIQVKVHCFVNTETTLTVYKINAYIWPKNVCLGLIMHYE